MNTFEQKLIEQYPPSTINDSRSIIRSYATRFTNHRSEYMARKLESLVEGVDCDYKADDEGEEPQTIKE